MGIVPDSGFVGKVVGVDANTMATDETRFEGHEVPFSLGGGEDSPVSMSSLSNIRASSFIDVHVAAFSMAFALFNAWCEVVFNDGEVELTLVRSGVEPAVTLGMFLSLRTLSPGLMRSVFEIFVVGEAGWERKLLQ